MTDKQKYYHLLGEVCEAMPPSAVDSAIRAGYGQEHKSASTRLHHVKQGKVASLPDLLALIQYSMPGYEVPTHLLPAEPARLMDAPGFRFRNLAAPLAAWLRAQGWTALEQAGVSTAILTAHWYTPAGDCFCLDYQWHSGTPGMACCCLALRAAGGTRETLFTNTAVRRLREARTMLCNNLVYMASRRAIAGPVGA